jgi:beta-lactamase superfamily II metal-dependent hydrolase
MVRDRLSIVLIIIVVLTDVLLWQRVLSPAHEQSLIALNIGQGDGTLAIFPNGMTVLTDAGPDGTVVRELERALGPRERTIDIAIITHPQLDHFGGLADILRRFSVRAVLVNGRTADDAATGGAWNELLDVLREQDISILRVEAGSSITQNGFGLDVLNPDGAWLQSGELNDTGLVALAQFRGWRALMTADIGGSVEEDIARRADIRADVLKVGHHGSRYSTSEKFLRSVAPRVALISAGARNRYGHPAPETLERLAAAGATVFRTDRNGAIRVTERDGQLLITTER